ncbi:pyridoxal-phosphate dependent enzyme [Pantoea cypripedii]|uniref:L-serine ammonia-lyase n=1 Tax=Pantoea cypripedii TaxID=55209 RepID=A0A1X1EVG1_PANCY|nr:pyridoxal-phosphate dependent enzyme [Pantoea cypripedii]MBP2198166.1 L-serine/L-threonine ammonia-lyase [Pantoea cypripedii]ORM94006.1 serine dehydratase [Pantoea cypripedii]
MPLHLNTPLLNSRPLSQLTGSQVWLKMDALQPSGSFKIRGVGLACHHYVQQGARRFISSSGGNAGLAVAYAGRTLGIPVTVIVPESTPIRARELLRLEQAEVIVHGVSWQEANQYAQSLLSATDAFIHPFDDPLLWQGHASLVDEVVAAGVHPDAVVLSVGGGGLLSGVIAGLQRNGLPDVPVIAVETAGAASFHAAIRAGHAVEIDRINTVATSLGAKKVCDQAVKLAGEHPVISEVVTDEEALRACRLFIDDHRVLTEPACGASLACLYQQKAVMQPYRNPLVVVCGGATLSLEQLLNA